MPKAVIIYGSPGSGKGTQAELLAKKLGLIHFDTGSRLKSILYAPGAEEDPVLKHEKELHNAGILNTPSWVLKIVREGTEKIAATGAGIVFSGSPRTIYEVEGEAGNPGLMSALEKVCGKENIFIFQLEISEEESARRNKGRVVCTVCKLPVLAASNLNICSFCGAPAERRPDDKPELMATRLKEYRERTEPIIKNLKSRGYAINKIDGLPAPYKVHEEILKIISAQKS